MRPAFRSLPFAIALCLQFCLFAACGNAWSQTAAPQETNVPNGGRSWNILTLPLVDPQVPVALAFARSFKDALQSAAPGNINVYTESFNAPNFEVQRMEGEMAAYLAKKYADKRIDLVVGLHTNNAAFIEKYHDKLWPGAAVMFTNILQSDLAPDSVIHKYPFVGWKLDVEGTLNLMQTLHPDAQRLVVVGGSSDLDDSLMRPVKATLANNKRWQVEYWTEYSQAQLRERLSLLPKDTLVLYTSMFKDSTGTYSIPRNALETIADKSSVPVFGMFSGLIGHRVVGGSLVDAQEVGRESAGLVLKVMLGNQRPLAEMQTYLGHHCVVDAKRLDEYGFSTRNLPAGCEIQNPIRNIWTDYKGILLAGMGIILVQGGTIGGLFWQRRRRRAAELKNRHTQSELQRAMRFATMGELTASIAHEINQPLGAILSNAEAAEMLLERGMATKDEIRAILGDIRRDDQRAHLVVSRLRTLLKKSEVQHEPVQVHQSIREALTLFIPEARRRGVAVALSLDAGSDLINGDKIQLQQVLLNLVMNAMDALDGTERHLRRIQIQTNSNQEHIIFSVQDNGHGMNDEAHARVFDSFYTTKQEGLGMGLTIVRTIVESMGGKISVQSEPGKGATFNVQLPLLKERS